MTPTFRNPRATAASVLGAMIPAWAIEPRGDLMLKRVRLFKDGAGFVLRITGIDREELERIPPSERDCLLQARIKELGLTDSADLLLKGEELVIPTTRHRWPMP